MIRNLLEYIIGPLCGARPRADFEYRPRSLLGSGCCVNSWMSANPWPIARALVRAGCNATMIEFLGWAKTGRYADYKPLVKPYKAWLAAMRHYRITTLVVLANDNAQESKYGNTGIPFIGAVADNIRAAADFVISCGGEGVILQPVAECGSSAGRAIEAYVMPRARSHRFVTAAENNGRTAGGQAEIIIRHPGSTSDWGGAGIVVVTDSQILRQLNAGGQLHTNADPAKLRAYAASVRAIGAGFLYYGFGQERPDYGSIEALEGLK